MKENHFFLLVFQVKPRSFGTQASKTSVTSTGSRFSYKKDELVAGLQLNMTAAEMRARVGGTIIYLPDSSFLSHLLRLKCFDGR